MNTYCYMRMANHSPMTQQQQAEIIRQVAEQKGYEVINTGCSALDARLLSLLQQKQIAQAVIIFRGH